METVSACTMYWTHWCNNAKLLASLLLSLFILHPPFARILNLSLLKKDVVKLTRTCIR